MASKVFLLVWCLGCIVALAFSFVGGGIFLSYIWVYLLASLPLARMIYPSLLGTFLTKVLYYTEMNKFPLDFGSINITPWFKDGTFYLWVQAKSICFGNPPGFPHYYFLEAYDVSLQLSTRLSVFRNLIKKLPKTRWSAFPSDCAKNTSHGTNPVESIGTVNIELLEIGSLMINFEMFNKEFNVNGFSRLIAEGKAFKPKFMKKHQLPRPNCLEVVVLGARNLPSQAHKSKPDPKVIVTLREQRFSTKTVMSSSDPVWKEHFELHLTDPSAVLHVQCYDENVVGKTLIGQWIITTKFLLMKPLHCWHDKDCVVNADGSLEGWFPLSNAHWDSPEEEVCGSIKLRLRWTNKDGFDQQYKPPVLSALDQLKQNSDETNLKLGNTKLVELMLRNFPLSVGLRRLTIRNIEFFLRDLFMGVEGAAEATGAMRAIPLPFLECTGASRWLQSKSSPPSAASSSADQPLLQSEGLDLYALCQGIVMALTPQVVKSKTLYNALCSILGGFARMSLAPTVPHSDRNTNDKYVFGDHTRRVKRHIDKYIHHTNSGDKDLSCSSDSSEYDESHQSVWKKIIDSKTASTSKR